MRWQGFTISEIVQSAGATLSANYQTLTGNTTPYPDLVEAVQAVNVTSDNPFPARLYQIHGDGTIWSYTGPPLTGWHMLDNNPGARAIAASGRKVYQLHDDGTIWLYTGPPMTGWQMLDNNPRACAIAAGDSLYQLHNDGTIWLYTGPPMTGWQMLDNDPVTTRLPLRAGISIRSTAMALSGYTSERRWQGGRCWTTIRQPAELWLPLRRSTRHTATARSGCTPVQRSVDGRCWTTTQSSRDLGWRWAVSVTRGRLDLEL